MVRITKVYTRTGDAGTTALIGGERVPKHAARIDCYGTVDELNAALGLVRTALEENADGELLPIVQRIQNELFNLGALLATPDAERRTTMPPVADRHVAALEGDIDAFNENLPPLKSFVLPGGGWVSSYLHLARTICRRAERQVSALAETADGAVDGTVLVYLNRLSDALFVFGRWAATRGGGAEPLWTPEDT